MESQFDDCVEHNSFNVKKLIEEQREIQSRKINLGNESKPPNKKHKYISDMQTYFIVVGLDKDKKKEKRRAKCNACGAELVGGESKYGTFTLSHLMLNLGSTRNKNSEHTLDNE